MAFNFVCSLSDTTIIPKHVEAADFPKVGTTYRIDLILSWVVEDQEYLIRINYNGENFELLEVFLKSMCTPLIVSSWKGTYVYAVSVHASPCMHVCLYSMCMCARLCVCNIIIVKHTYAHMHINTLIVGCHGNAKNIIGKDWGIYCLYPS